MTVWTNFRTGAFVIAMVWLASEIFLGLIARSKGGALKRADRNSMGLIWLIEKGLYKFIRHPAYTGSLLTFLGFGLTFSNWLSALVLFVPLTGVFLYRIHVEEQALTEFFGDAYLQYRRRTKRLFPGIY